MEQPQRGAGILPFSIQCENGNKTLYFLFHRTFSGKKANTLIDFGGAWEEELGEDSFRTAAREFSEETCGIFFPDFKIITEAERILNSFQYFDAKLRQKEGIWESCVPCPNKGYPHYNLFLMEIPYRDEEELNALLGTAEKKRELLWVKGEDISSHSFPLFVRLQLLVPSLSSVIENISNTVNTQKE